MGAKEEGKFQRDLNSELGKTATAYDKIKAAQQDILFFARDYADEAKKAVKEIGDGSIAASETAKAFRDVASAAKGITDNYAEVLTGEKTFQDLIKERQQLNAAQKSFNTEFEQQLYKLRFSQEEINAVVHQGADAFEILDAKGQDISGSQMELLALFMEQNDQLAEEADNMQAIADAAQNIDSAMRPLGDSAISLQDIGEGLEKGLGKAGLGGIAGQLGLGDAVKDARMYAAELTKGGTEALGLGGKFKVAGKMAAGMGSALVKSLGPVAIIAKSVEMLVGAFKALDSGSGEMAKNFGISAKEGQGLMDRSRQAAQASGDMLVSMNDVKNAQIELNKVMGTGVEFSGEFAAEFASVKERTGLSDQAMGKFASKAQIAGTSIKDQLVKVQAVTLELNAQNGIALNVKDIQEGIGKISNANALSAKNNTKEMANQVFQAKMLGLEQGKVNDIADGLLDFQSSIEAEMKAELLTGKQLNLEKARTAALNNDMATVAAELAKQGVTAAEFGNMNRIQQEAIAASMGMSRDEMGDMLMNQEKLASIQSRYGDDVKSMSDVQAKYQKALEDGTLTEEMKAQLAEDGVLAQMESATAQDKLNAAMEKMQDLFVGLITPLMPLIDAIMALLDPVFKILTPIFNLIGELVKLIVSFLTPAIDAISNMFGGFATLFEGIVNLDFGMMLEGLKAVGVGIIDFLIAPFDGLVNLLNKIPGVSIPKPSTMIKGLVGLAEGGIVTKPTTALIGEGGEPEAVIPLSQLDQVAGGGGKTTASLLKQLNANVVRLINVVEAGGDVYMDGNKVGKSLALATSNMG